MKGRHVIADLRQAVNGFAIAEACDGDLPVEVEDLINDLCGKESLRALAHIEKLERVAELVEHAGENRSARDWTLMHLDISEAIKLVRDLRGAA